MKRIITCLLCIALLTTSLCACFADFNFVPFDSTTKEVNTGTAESTPDVTTPEVTAPETTTPEVTTPTQSSADVPPVNNETNIVTYMEYYNFEDACSNLATDVVVATYRGLSIYGLDAFGSTIVEYNFEVKERVLGDAHDQISVYDYKNDIFVNSPMVGSYCSQIFMTPGVDYLLVLDHRPSVYDNTDVYLFVCSIYIDASNIEESRMYSQSIYPHSNKFDFSKADFQQVFEYIKELVKDNTPSVQIDKTLPVNEIIKKSTDILVVKVGKCERKSVDAIRDIGYYTCTVSETLLGSVKPGATIEIKFRNEDVAEGDEIVVALNKTNGLFYQITSLNSIFSTDQKDELASLIANP